jgi:precorrin-6B methylase 2
MLPAEMLAVRPGDRVLDLCAAPGGKSTRLAASVGETGLLWANEINGERARALLRNLELCGSDRTIVTVESPARLAERLPGFFDRILVDAPCSGSGMFRRDPQAAASWERYGPAACAAVQTEILEAADQMLRPGGFLVYSTCSFSVTEDEQMIAQFLARHPGYRVMETERLPGTSPGLAIASGLEHTVRIWPHLARGDGHFAALLQKQESAAAVGMAQIIPERSPLREKRLNRPSRDGRTMDSTAIPADEAIRCFLNFAAAAFSPAGLARLKSRENQACFRLPQARLHLVPMAVREFSGLHFLKTGLFLGQIRPVAGRAPARFPGSRPQPGPRLVFEPAHALALTLNAADFRYALCLEADDPLLLKYLRGETIERPQAAAGENAWPPGAYVAICLRHFPLGWARVGSAGLLKNLYPPAWRKLN